MANLGKALLVCARRCDNVERLLVEAGCSVTRVNNGETAISQAHKYLFDAAILVSTGENMDLAETVLNLRDIHESMQIIAVAEPSRRGETEIAQEIAAHNDSNTRVLSMEELSSLLHLLKGLQAQG